MFSTEHYKAVSAVIMRQIERGKQAAFEGSLDYALGIDSTASAIAGELADTFEADSSHFRRDLFLKACGLEQ